MIASASGSARAGRAAPPTADGNRGSSKETSITTTMSTAFRVAAVLFDFDDTLTAPGALDFALIRRELACPAGMPILEFIASLASAEERLLAHARLRELEMDAAARARPSPDAEKVIGALREMGLPLGILTRNGRLAVERALDNFPGLEPADFRVIVSRDDHVLPKPAGDGVSFAARSLDVDVRQVMVVGDYVFDVLAGNNAGALTVLLRPGALLDAGYGSPATRDRADPTARPTVGTVHTDGSLDPGPDWVIRRLAELPSLVRLGRPLPAGKFPADLLEEYLDSLSRDDPDVLVGPRLGRDVAAIRPSPATDGCTPSAPPTLAVGADPVTFATDDLGAWAVQVNTNDIATCGASPRWFFATVLHPVGSTPSQVLEVLDGVRRACDEHGITLCGGHTEITDAVVRPIVSGTMLGIAGVRGLLDKGAMREGDVVILTKGVAVEGTALLASELDDHLRGLGMSDDELRSCRDLRHSIGVTTEAGVAAGFAGVSAMHDVTEGGLAAAVVELSAAGGHAIAMRMDAVPVYALTRRVCDLLEVDPLGLIGSGSLLIVCRPDDEEPLRKALVAAGIEATLVGTVAAPLAEPAGHVTATASGAPAPWPHFEVDEVARILGRSASSGK